MLGVEPNARLVIEIYQPLMSFVQEIETALGFSSQGYGNSNAYVTQENFNYILSYQNPLRTSYLYHRIHPRRFS